MGIIWGIFLFFVASFIFMIVVGAIQAAKEKAAMEAKIQHNIAEKARKEKEELETRREIANRLSNSNVFKELEARVFVPDKARPREVYWDSDSKSVSIDYEDYDYKTIPGTDIPNGLEFMRALGHKHGYEYTYTEYLGGGCGYDADSARLTRKQKQEQKTSW